MFKIIKNAKVYAPDFKGDKDILIYGSRIAQIDDHIELQGVPVETIDAEGKIVTPGLIDQHIHITGAGGKHGFSSMTPEVSLSELIKVGSTTVMGMLGTDGSIRNLSSLYGKAKALDTEGLTAYMLTSYFYLPPFTITDSVQNDMIFIDKVLGCKLSLSDSRSSFPEKREILDILRQVRVGGVIGQKKGILHIHMGGLDTRMDLLMEIVEEGLFPIQHISPTHVGRTRDLFDQSILFAKKGGMIDISTGGSKFDEPHRVVAIAIENEVPISNLTFSTDGNAGLDMLNGNGELIGFRKAPIYTNLTEVQAIIHNKILPIQDAIRLVTLNPANNLGLKHKGAIQLGYDADLCFFDESFELTDVIAQGQLMMRNLEILKKGSFETVY